MKWLRSSKHSPLKRFARFPQNVTVFRGGGSVFRRLPLYACRINKIDGIGGGGNQQAAGTRPAASTARAQAAAGTLPDRLSMTVITDELQTCPQDASTGRNCRGFACVLVPTPEARAPRRRGVQQTSAVTGRPWRIVATDGTVVTRPCSPRLSCRRPFRISSGGWLANRSALTD